MIYGTAGFTAAQCVTAIVERGIEPERGPVVVTGATGGVGSLAVAILAKLGYEVARRHRQDASSTIGCDDWAPTRFSAAKKLLDDSDRPLLASSWAAAVDTVGGKPLATILALDATSRLRGRVRTGRRGGSAAHRVSIHSARRDARRHRLGQVPAARAARNWQKLAGPWRIDQLDELADEITLDELPDRVQKILAGQIVGRTLVLPRRQERCAMT